MHMMEKFNTYVNNIKKLFNKDITEQVTKYRIPLITAVIVILLACISIFVTYAFYKVEDVTPIVGGSTGDIADLDLRIMVEDRNSDGSAKVGEYILYPYIPQAGYEYNEAKSYCTNGSTINYNEDIYDVDIVAQGHDVCYMYFDSIAELDITLYVWAENVNSDGEGTGKYTKLETQTMPSIGYELNSEMTTCTENATVSYQADQNKFNVNASGKAVCNAYMDAIDVDIALKIYLQAKTGSSLYYENDEIPTNVYYELNNTKSSCTGTSTLDIQNQKVVVAATSRTSCVAYLDVSSGPILESMEVTTSATNAVITLASSNLGTSPVQYYYSNNGGESYVSSTSNTYTFNMDGNSTNDYKAYYSDASGKLSAIFDTNDYIFNGLYDYANYVQTLTVPRDGYYLLEVWGAQGGSVTYSTSYRGGYGGYAKGLIKLNKDDSLFIVTGGSGTGGISSSSYVGGYNGGGSTGGSSGSDHYHSSGGGATHIATQTGLLSTLENNKDAILIVAGGGGGGYVHTAGASYSSIGGDGGGYIGNNSTYASTNGKYGLGGSQTSGGKYYNSTEITSSVFGSFGLGGIPAFSWGSAGGGGYYGGGASYGNTDANGNSGGGGGSGYIGNPLLLSSSELSKSMYCYNCTASSVAETRTISTTNVSATATSNYAKQGNGYARITYVGSELS